VRFETEAHDNLKAPTLLIIITELNRIIVREYRLYYNAQKTYLIPPVVPESNLKDVHPSHILFISQSPHPQVGTEIYV
jgi:hypothetical protein